MPAMPDRPGLTEQIVRGPVPVGRRARRAVEAGDDPVLRQRPRAPPARPRPSWPSTTTSAAELWSATSYKTLREEALIGRAVEPPAPVAGAHGPARHVSCSREAPGPIIAVTDFMKIVPEQIARFLPGRTFVPLGTDGMGRSDTREALRRHFEIDTGHVVVGVLTGLLADGVVDAAVVADAIAPLRHRPRRRRPLPLLTCRRGQAPSVSGRARIG